MERHGAAVGRAVTRVILCVRSVTMRGPQAVTAPKKVSREELLKMQTPKRMPLVDRQARIQFLEKRYGPKLRGQDIRFMKNAQLYALSEQAGYRRR